MSTPTKPPVLTVALVAGALLFALAAALLWPISSIRTPPQTATPVASSSTSVATDIPPPTSLYQYLEVIDSCDVNFEHGPCVNMRSGPGLEFPVIKKLRSGIVFKIASSTIVDGRTWYKIGYDGEIHYPERVESDWYVAADYVHEFLDPGLVMSSSGPDASSAKHIIIDLSRELLSAYDGDTLFMQQSISTGLELTPTPVGAFWIYRKMPDSYMQGPIPGLSDQYYDLPGVPWDLYFTKDGGAIHGAYWHDHFGQVWSHGCVNLPPDQAKILYQWAALGTPVTVQP